MERNQKIADLLRELAASFLSRVDNKTSLITVTRCDTSPDLKRATVFITVLPENKEEEALHFTKRQRSELRDYLKKNMKAKVIPFIDFEIDLGEKTRQKIDQLVK